MSNTNFSNSSSGHIAVSLEFRNSSEVRLLLISPAYDCPQTTFVVPYKASVRIYRKHVALLGGVTSLRMRAVEVCLPRRCLEAGCITPLFHCCVLNRVCVCALRPLPSSGFSCRTLIERNRSDCKYVEIFTHSFGSTSAPSRRTEFIEGQALNDETSLTLRVGTQRLTYSKRKLHGLMPK
jgi:hypothetical protein